MKKGSLEKELSNLISSSLRSPKYLKGKGKKTCSGVVQINTSILSDKTVQAVCDTLRRFQSKIKVVELYHNQDFKAGTGSNAGKGSPSNTYQRMHSPQKSFAQLALPWSFPRPTHLFNLLKSLTKVKILRVISDVDCATFITEQHYQAFINSIGRSASDQASEGGGVNTQKRQGKQVLGTVDI